MGSLGAPPVVAKPSTARVVAIVKANWPDEPTIEAKSPCTTTGEADCTRLERLAHFDNSRFNPYSHGPMATVRYGEQSHEEMMYGFAFYTEDDEELDLKVDPKTGVAVKAKANR